MPSAPDSRIAQAKRSKNSTPHQKNHRWESFTTKISKLHTLDPLRKVRRHDLDEEDLSTQTSYFRTGIAKWSELNVSKGFVSFKREVNSLSESLPQILHHEAQIMQALAGHISTHDKESLEPLLDLLTALARDLGQRFEKHYPQSLRLIVELASKPQPVEVIEWTFTALAFLFKYLYKLLVGDLRPTYDYLAPLLGKGGHPPHIARFAAEAFSYLVRKAASPAHRRNSLTIIIDHVKKDLYSTHGSKSFPLFQDGLMTMFAESIKGPANTIHSTGSSTFISLLEAIPAEDSGLAEYPLWTNVSCGVLTSLIHHTTSSTLEDLIHAILKHTQLMVSEDPSSGSNWSFVPLLRILGLLGGVRKGTRVIEWEPLVDVTVKLLKASATSNPTISPENTGIFWAHVIVNITLVWEHAPISALTPAILPFTDIISRDPYRRWYIPFCAFLSILEPDRFRSLFLSHLQSFVNSHWSEGTNEDLLCAFLPRMAHLHAIPHITEKEIFALPLGWQDQIVAKFEQLEISPFPERGVYGKDPQTWRDRCLPKYSALLEILELATVHPSTSARVAELLLRKLKLSLRPSTTLASDEVHFIVSQGLHAYLHLSCISLSVDTSLSLLLRAATPRFHRSIGFLTSFLEYELHLVNSKSDSSGIVDGKSSPLELGPITTSLIQNLSAPSHKLRLVSLKLLGILDPINDDHGLLQTMIEFEETSPEAGNVRKLGMLLRNLAQHYLSLSQDSWMVQAVPSFLFGSLTVKLAPVWDSTIEGLKQIVQSRNAEESVLSLALDWLQIPSARSAGPKTVHVANPHVTTGFDCTNVLRLEESAQDLYRIVDEPVNAMLQSFDEKQHSPELYATNARAQALKVLAAVPRLAEKRSRALIPLFLSWAAVDDDADAETDQKSAPETKNWSLSDRKLFLAILTQFTNPRTLYLQDRVYQALLGLLENGDGEVQKLVLKAIFTWKQVGITPYRENLEYLLDDARFKNELTVLFQGDQSIQSEHKKELMPVLLRLLYGRAISKKGSSSGHEVRSTRLAVLRKLNVEDFGQFINIALGDLKDVEIFDKSGLLVSLVSQELMPVRRQVGFLNMVSSIISELGTHVFPYTGKLANSILYCIIFSSRRLAMEAEADSNSEVGDDITNNTSLLKVARTTGLKCLISLFENATGFDWTPFSQAIVAEILTPRLAKLPTESAQGVSGILRLVYTWSCLPKDAIFLSLDSTTFPRIVECLTVEKGKDEVKIYVLTIIQNLIKLTLAPAHESQFNELIKSEILDPTLDQVLTNLTTLLENQSIGDKLLAACVEVIIDIAPIVETSHSPDKIVDISTQLLTQTSRRLSPKQKARVLLILEQFIALQPSVADGAVSPLLSKVHTALAPLFSYFKDRESRLSLNGAFSVLATKDTRLSISADFCRDLNSFASGRIDEPDYDRRLKAFTAISQSKSKLLSPDQWLPILHNLVFYMFIDEEYGILSSNATDAIRAFIEIVAGCEDPEDRRIFEDHLKSVLLPAVFKGIRDSSETVRRSCLRIFGHLLSQTPNWDPVHDMKLLLGDPTEDSADPPFFFHILSPAISRQVEAFQMLRSANDRSELSSQNISKFFIPLLEHFIFDRPDGGDDQGIAAQATSLIHTLALSLDWKHYRSILQRYISFIESKPDQQKVVVRLLGQFADALVSSHSKRSSDMDLEIAQSGRSFRRLASTLPSAERLQTETTNNFLPPLISHLHEKDESEVSYRVPVGVILVKLIKLLPPEEMNSRLAGVLTDICHILRSKAWESREMTRDTLVKTSLILGPSYFGFIVKELRSALRRGYQLHVLSYTVHSMLLACIPEFGQGSLDYCLSTLVGIIMDDIFGAAGQEKDAEGYISQMKEVKTSKSQDSMELIAKTASINHLVHLIHPLQALLLQKVNLKLVRKIDTLLSRILSGILQNPAAESQDMLVFCYEVIQEVYSSQKVAEGPKLDPRVRRYLVDRGSKRSEERGVTSKYTFKLVRFSLDILRSVLKKYDALRTPANVAGFIPILGDSILSGEDEVKIAAFKFVNVIIKVPMDSAAASGLFSVAVKEATKSISTAPSTTSDLSQAALKFVSAVIRDRRDIPLKDTTVDMLLQKLRDDLTDPQYRHVTFNFLRSVLDRKIETAVVYDMMDHVGTIMITNDDKDTRDLARGAFFQFLREYPQKKARWTKQLNFIVVNLQYEREGGRLSIMEIIHLLLLKSADGFTQEVAATCFLPLTLVLANDDSEKCRLAAGQLLKQVFGAANRDQTQKFLGILRSWLSNQENEQVTKLALHSFGLFFGSGENSQGNQADFGLVLAKVYEILGATDTEEQSDGLLNTTIDLARVLAETFPDIILSSAHHQLWKGTRRFMVHTSPSVRLNSTRLISTLLSDFATTNKTITHGDPLQNSYGLILKTDDIQVLVWLAGRMLSAPTMDEELSKEVVQILIFLGLRLPRPSPSDISMSEADGEEDEDEEDGGNVADDHEDGVAWSANRPRDICYLFWKLSSILRRPKAPRSEAIVGKVAAMEVLEALCRRIPIEDVQSSIKSILVPLHHLTDRTIAAPFSTDELFKTRHEGLATRAQILMDLLQHKLGTGEYTKHFLAVREEVKERRMQRLSKRKIEAVTRPEKHGRDKRKKFEKKKEKRRERGKDHKAMRQAFKGW